jgi:hypothetical protein
MLPDAAHKGACKHHGRASGDLQNRAAREGEAEGTLLLWIRGQGRQGAGSARVFDLQKTHRQGRRCAGRHAGIRTGEAFQIASEGAQADAFVSGKLELGYTAPEEAGEEVPDFKEGTVALGWSGLLHARKTAAPLPSAVDAVRWAYTVVAFCQNNANTSGTRSTAIRHGTVTMLARVE